MKEENNLQGKTSRLLYFMSELEKGHRLPKTGTVSEVFMSLVAGIMFTLGAFLGLKKKDQD